MKTVGIVVEYNPLHYGHVYHFEQSKAASGADCVVAVMSGHFLQRGEPAIVNKWARAEMALRMGADVVIELPAAYASQPAEWFAYGAVALLDATGVVDSLCFGSESGEIGWLLEVADRMKREPDDFRAAVKRQLKNGVNYPAAYSAAVAEFVDGVSDDELHKPNNTLGLHYLIALGRLGSRIEPMTITRQKAGYHQHDVTDARIASATAIRRLLFEEGDLEAVRPLVPSYTFDILRREWTAGRAPLDWSRFLTPLLYRLASSSAEELASFAEVSEGLEHRIKRLLPELEPVAPDAFERLLGALKTKRYTRTKLQRTLLRILLGHRKTDLSSGLLAQGPSYIRILGFSEQGRQLLKKMKKTARFPLVTKVTRHASPFLELDIRATSVYALGYRSPSGADLMSDYYISPVQGFADPPVCGGSEAK